jgi:hypothetical protein
MNKKQKKNLIRILITSILLVALYFVPWEKLESFIGFV